MRSKKIITHNGFIGIRIRLLDEFRFDYVFRSVAEMELLGARRVSLFVPDNPVRQISRLWWLSSLVECEEKLAKLDGEFKRPELEDRS